MTVTLLLSGDGTVPSEFRELAPDVDWRGAPAPAGAEDVAALLDSVRPDVVVSRNGAGALALRGAHWLGGTVLVLWTELPAGGDPDSPGASWTALDTGLSGLVDQELEGTAAEVAGILARDLPTLLRNRGAPAVRELLEENRRPWLDLLAWRQALADGDRPRWLRAARAPLGSRPERRATGTVGQRPRILAISHDIGRTGAPLALLEAVRHLDRTRPDLAIEVLGLGHGELEGAFREAFGDRFRRIDHEHGKAAPVVAAIDDARPDLVLLNSTTLYVYAIHLAAKGIPFVWWSHEGIDLDSRDGHLFTIPELEHMTAAALALAPALLTSSMHTVRQLERFVPEVGGRVGHAPYGFDLDAIEAARLAAAADRSEAREALGVGAGHLLFTCVGSLVARKNQLTLLRAFLAMIEELPAEERERWHLQFLGDEEAEPDYVDEIRAAAAASAQVHFRGRVPSAWRDIAISDAHVLVSTNECSPLVNLEAMLLGTPVISSAVHGIPEVLGEGDRGELVDPEDLQGIARALRATGEASRSGDARLTERTEAARLWAREHHGLEVMGERVGEALDALAASAFAVGGDQGFLAGAAVDAALERSMMRLWSVAKGDPAAERHIVLAGLARAGAPMAPAPAGKRLRRKIRGFMSRLRGGRSR